MTRKHFESVAAILYDNRLTPKIEEDGEPNMRIEGYNEALGDIALDLARYFSTENERFDYNRFLRACGV